MRYGHIDVARPVGCRRTNVSPYNLIIIIIIIKQKIQHILIFLFLLGLFVRPQFILSTLRWMDTQTAMTDADKQ